jgi:hypothetical protein
LVYDDILIGSGLSALGVALGLPATRKVLVLSGPAEGSSRYYDATQTVPCAHLGHGGLGNYWHGVIPTGMRENFAACTPEDFAEVFEYFYPGASVAPRIGRAFLFVPWRPIRPRAVWPRLIAERAGRVSLSTESAIAFSRDGTGVEVETSSARHRGARLWLCAGTLETPALLDRSLDAAVSRQTVSDHVLCYVGQVDRARHADVLPPAVERTRQGLWFEGRYNDAGTGLFTLRPARFGFSTLDFGIERRAVFGLPTGNAVKKIVRSASPGLVAEALYNRAGLFPGARFQSVYAQLAVRDAYWRRSGDTPLEMRLDVIRNAAAAVRAAPAWPEVTPSRRPDIFIPGIHLHHSVDAAALLALDVNTPTANVCVADASVYEHIGPDHHTFKVIVAAYRRARSKG